MSAAADTGKTLLAQVEETTLASLLPTLTPTITPSTPTSTFGIPALDNLIHPPPQQQQQHQQQEAYPIITLESAHPAPPPLYQALAHTVTHHAAAAVILDCTHTFSPTLLTQYLHHLHHHHSMDPSSLNHIHILHPPSLPSLIHTINHHLPTYLHNSTTSSIDRPLALLTLLDISSLSWSTRLATDTALLDAERNPAPPTSADLTRALRDFQACFRCSIIITTAQSPPWDKSYDIRVAHRRMHVRRFPAGYSVVDAERDRGKRAEALRTARTLLRVVRGVGTGVEVEVEI